MKRIFHNTPREIRPQVVATTGKFAVEEVKKESWDIGNMFVVGIKIVLVLAILGFLGFKVYQAGKDVVNKRQELWFAYTHTDMVKPIRVLYEKSHEQADSDLRQILSGGK